MSKSKEHSMTLTILATTVVRSESTSAVIESLEIMKSDPEQEDYLNNITDALGMLDIVANEYLYGLKDDEDEEPEDPAPHDE